MRKRSIKSQFSNQPKKQAKITSFTQQQPSSNLLRSKDGLKQGRIEAFMVPKRCLDKSPNEESASLRHASSDCSSKKCGSTLHRTAIVDLTNVDLDSVGSSNSQSDLETSTVLKVEPDNSNAEIESNVHTVTSVKLKEIAEEDISEIIDCSISTESTKTTHCTEPVNHINETSTDSVNLDFNDSFLIAALGNESPVKEPKRLQNRLLPFSLPCNSSSHSLARLRFKVIEVFESSDAGVMQPKTLLLENVATRRKLECKLCGGWETMDVVSGDIVNIIGKQKDIGNEMITIDSRNNLIVVHPDILLSGTSLSNAIACRRRAVLSERFKNTEIGDSKSSMLIGTVVHTLFQIAVKEGNPTTEGLLDAAKHELSKPPIMRDILLCGSSQSELLGAVKEFIPQIIKFCHEYIRKIPHNAKGALDVKLPADYGNDALGIKENDGASKFPANIALSQVRDIEENVWSPVYGLKGKIDLSSTFLVKRRTRSKPVSVRMPLELKTGRASHSVEHYAQVAIYSMFTKQRESSNSEDETVLPAGLLLYLKNMELSCVPLKRADERELMLIRNQIVSSLTKSVVETERLTYEPASFPPVIDDERACSRCSQLRNCSLISRSVEKSRFNHTPPYMNDLIAENTSHLKIADFNYFNQWLTCTLLETRKAMKHDLAQYYWLRLPSEREQAGSCIAGLTLAGPQKSAESGSYLQTFKRSSYCEHSSIKFDNFHVGELVVISGEEPVFVAMASGTVFDISQSFITVRTDRCFEGYDSLMTYSIDRHEWSSMNSFNSSFQNISILMQNTPTVGNLREMIVHYRRPTFKKSIADVIPRSAKDEVAKMLRGLNRTQRQAIKRVLLSNDYTLVVGMPGSGKTTTIVAMVRILLLCGCRILITSYTHSAIDTLLMKLIKYKVKFLRLGTFSKIHPAVQRFSEEELCRDFKSPEELEQLYTNSNVVGCTCIAASSHPLFSGATKRSKFDVCIVDEASQISQPACLAPLFHASRFFLVGDHQQLPPLVRSKKARSIGADESLFRRLTCNEDALCYLTLQYRMNSAIMDVSNYVTYEGRLECATEATANAVLDLPNFNVVTSDIRRRECFVLNGKSSYDKAWILSALDPTKPVVFIDTSTISAYEEEIDAGLCNKFEADILKIIVQLLLKAGCNPNSIGVIAPFRRQVKLIEERLSDITDRQADNIEVSTVDKYQGRDKDVVLMSFVKSRNEASQANAGELLNDHRRLNVALTRAKRKMILVGCQKTLPSYEPCKKLLTYLLKNDMVLSL